MKRTTAIIIIICLVTNAFAQSVELARTRMNEGKYESARTYWEALDDDGRYTQEIETCRLCNRLQQEAAKLANKGRYDDAIGKYREILSKNPTDTHCKKQIKRYQSLADETKLVTYSNYVYDYSIKYPQYMKLKNSSDVYRHFASDDKYNIRLYITARMEYENLSSPVRKLLQKERDSYISNYNVIRETIKTNEINDDWMVVDGKYQNGEIFYNKTFIETRKSSCGYYRVYISAIAVASSKDKRGIQLAECIKKHFTVEKGVVITDNDIWTEARKQNTTAAYQKYLNTSGEDGKHRAEAQAFINLQSARDNYHAKQYRQAKNYYELAKSYPNIWESDDSMFYRKACEEVEYEQLSHWYNRANPNLSQLLRFREYYPDSEHLPEINGLIVKAYCLKGDFNAAQKTVDDYWPDILTPESQSKQSKNFWKGIIRQYKKQYRKTKSNSGLHNSAGGRQAKSSFGHMWEFGTDWRCNGKSYWGVNTAFCIGTLEKRFNLDFRINPSVTFSKNLDKELYPRWFCPITMGTRLYLNPGHGEDWFCYVEPEVGYSINASGVFGGRFVFGYDIFGINIGGLWTMTSMPYNTSNSKFVYAGIGINIYLWN